MTDNKIRPSKAICIDLEKSRILFFFRVINIQVTEIRKFATYKHSNRIHPRIANTRRSNPFVSLYRLLAISGQFGSGQPSISCAGMKKGETEILARWNSSGTSRLIKLMVLLVNSLYLVPSRDFGMERERIATYFIDPRSTYLFLLFVLEFDTKRKWEKISVFDLESGTDFN